MKKSRVLFQNYPDANLWLSFPWPTSKLGFVRIKLPSIARIG
jgi:hypothetical protein